MSRRFASAAFENLTAAALPIAITMNSKKTKQQRHPLLKGSLLAAGIACTALAVLGIFLPLLPTVPFLLLAAACFARSSEKWHAWLLEHQRFGPVISGYLAGSGIPRRAKISAILMLWLSMSVSALFLVPLMAIKLLLLAIAICVTIYLLRLPVAEK